MNTPILGTLPRDVLSPDTGFQVPIDMQALLKTRLLVQSNSGGGKSYAVRRVIEQTADHIQQLVIDPEGEFATLREKHDFIICAPHDGDAVANPKTAALLARRLLEAGVSAVLDIYDLKAAERHAFVHRFIDALVNAPRRLWHPLMLVLDEAHVFCPQVGSSEAAQSVIDVCTRGRKRGFCTVLATQRLAKLHKDAAAEMLNKLVGRTGMDIDVKRAAEELGMTAREAMATLRTLEPGEFYMYGPALSRNVERVLIGPVFTSHPEAGQGLMQAPPPASATVLESLAKLADLQKDAEDEARTVEELLAKNADLARQIKAANKRAEQAGVPEAEVTKRIQTALREQAVKQADDSRNNSRNNLPLLRELKTQIDNVRATLFDWIEWEEKHFTKGPRVASLVSRDIKNGIPFTPTFDRQVIGVDLGKPGSDLTGIPKGEAAILAACIQFPNGLRRQQLSTLTAYKKSSRDTYIARLRVGGFVEVAGDRIVATDVGRVAMPNAEPLPTGEALQDFWLQRLPTGEAAILRILIEMGGGPVSRDAISDATDYKKSSRDTYLARLATKELTTEPARGYVAAIGTLFTLNEE